MLNVDIDRENGIAILKPGGELSENDFIAAAKSIDPYIETSGNLKGLIIYVESFPGWDSFSAFIAHMKFVKEHHKSVSHVAFVTDSTLGSLAENVASHFIEAEIKHFSFNALDDAKKWIRQ